LEGVLDDSADLCQLNGLESMPHSTTFQKASRKPLARELAQLLLGETVKRVSGRRKSVEHAAIVSTGLECTVASNYFVSRRVRAGTPLENSDLPRPFSFSHKRTGCKGRSNVFKCFAMTPSSLGHR
jgi:hypothetical protein